MALHALVSAGGSPGVTTTSLALALAWPAPVLLAECDPSGGDILAGLFGGHLPARDGLLSLALAAPGGPGAVSAALPAQLTDLDEDRSRALLPGLTDPRQSAAAGPAWPALAAALAAAGSDVLADCGRLDGAAAPLPVLAAAATVLLVLRPTLRQVSRARPRAAMLAEILGGLDRVALLLVGEGAYSTREIREALGAPVAGTLPADPRSAQFLSDGTGRRRSLASGPLMRAAGVTARALHGRMPAAPRLAHAAGRHP